MDRKKIERINELAKKSKITSLTPEELYEQALLRKEYLENVRRNFKMTLENITIVENSTKA